MFTIGLSAGLVCISAVLVAWHVRGWRQADHGGLGEQERDFHARRFRRRVQASAMVGVIGLLLLGELWLKDPRVMLLYWSGVVLLLLWLLLLAASDWLASRVHFRGPLSRLQQDRVKLQADIDKLRRDRNKPSQ
jgi:hypothetical protein